MKRIFLFVFAVTVGVLFFLAAVGGGWSLRFYETGGDMIPATLNLTSVYDSKLFANESTTLAFRTVWELKDDLFDPDENMDLSRSRADAEKYLENLEKFRERFWPDEVLLINESLEFRQKLPAPNDYSSPVLGMALGMRKKG